MNHTELTNHIAFRTGLDARQVSATLASLAEVVADTLAQGHKVSVNALFTAEAMPRPERAGRNPQTGEPMVIPAGTTVRLRPAAALKRAV